MTCSNSSKTQAQAAGIDVTKPFPFLLAGTPVEIKWHINVDRTEGKPITKELFAKSKQPFITKNEPVDIIGFYSENHAGVFLSPNAPAIKEGSGMKNAIHIHLVSRTSKASGHIDDLMLGKAWCFACRSTEVSRLQLTRQFSGNII